MTLGGRFTAAVSAALGGLIAVYPLVFLWLNDRVPRGALVAGFGVLVAFRLVAGRRLSPLLLRLLLPLLALFCALVLLDPQLRPLKAYPVLLCLAGFAYCAYTLHSAPSAIERLMRRTGLQPTPLQARYMRGVTWLWLVFFGLNAVITAYLGWYASLELWAWHTGFVSYLVMGLLLAGEYLFRLWYRRREVEESW